MMTAYRTNLREGAAARAARSGWFRLRIGFASCCALAGLTAAVAHGATPGVTPEYPRFELQCRANFNGAFRLPNGSFFTNNTAAINDQRQVAVKISVVGSSDTQGVWVGDSSGGAIRYTSPVGAALGGVSLNNAGRVVFDQTFSSQNGLYRFDLPTGSSALLTTLPLGASTWGSPQVNAHGQVGYRAGFLNGQALASFDGLSSVAIHAAEAGLLPGSPYSFIFTPAFNGARRIAAKVRLGPAGVVGESQPDQVRIFEPDGSSRLIAADRDGDPASPYSRFDNAVALTSTGRVAFIATLVAGGRGVFLSDGQQTLTIATTAGPASDIEFFAPAVNDAGLVAFRARDVDGLRAIWVGDGRTLRRVIGEHDLVPTDLGIARIDQHDASPVFGGGVALNAAGDLTFNAALTPPDNPLIEWGSGIFVAIAQTGLTGDLNCDGLVNFDDITPFVLAVTSRTAYEDAWPDCRWLNGDVDGDGDVDFDDITPFVQLLAGG